MFELRRICFAFALCVLSCPGPLVATVVSSDLAAARALFDNRQLAEAQAEFEKIAAAHPSDATTNYYLGELALRRDEPGPAANFFEKAVAGEPGNSRYLRRLGDAFGRHAQTGPLFSRLGLAKKCLASYQRAVAANAADVDAHNSLFDYYLQAPGFAGGSTEKAIAEATTIKRLDPARGRIVFATLYVAEKQYDRALAEFEEVLRTNPDDFAALYQLGRLAALTGRFVDRGIVTLRRCLELPAPYTVDGPGHSAARWRLGALLEKKGDVEGARAAYAAAIKIDPMLTAAADALRKLK